MKKRIFILLAAAILIIPAFIAYGDAIFERTSNDFYYKYNDECLLLDRSFVNMGDKPISVMLAPNSKKELALIEPEEVVHIYSSCLYKGDFWGITSRDPRGWVKLSELLVLYDYVAFEEEHLEEFYTYKGDYSEIEKTKSALAWGWPGADAPMWTFEDLDTTSFSVLYAYKDSDGREWGFVTYLYDSPNIWLCLNDPLNRDMPVLNPAPKATVWESETAHNDIFENTENPAPLIIILVLVLVIGTALLIRVFWKPNSGKAGNKND